MFAGFVLLFLIILGCIIVSFNFSAYEKSMIIGVDIFQFLVYVLMTVACVTLYAKLIKLHVNPHPISRLDDMLLMICLPSFFLLGILQLSVIFFNTPSPTRILRIFAVLTQVTIQTPLIIDGLRRCSNSEKLRGKRLGRNTLLFLIIANIAVYIMETVLLKVQVDKTERNVFS